MDENNSLLSVLTEHPIVSSMILIWVLSVPLSVFVSQDFWILFIFLSLPLFYVFIEIGDSLLSIKSKKLLLGVRDVIGGIVFVSVLFYFLWFQLDAGLLSAILNLVVVFVCWLLFFYGVFFLYERKEQKHIERIIEELSLYLGISSNELMQSSNDEKITSYFAQKYSTESFQNRLSDFIGGFLKVLNWLLSTIQVLMFVSSIGFIIYGHFNNAIALAWGALGLAVISSIFAMLLILICSFVTGRYPGEAKRARKTMFEVINSGRGKRKLELI